MEGVEASVQAMGVRRVGGGVGGGVGRSVYA